MSDYLLSLAARSLRRAPACEPRRAHMFEPRLETPGSALVDEVREGLPEAANVSGAPAPYEHGGGVLSEPRAERDEPRPDFNTTQSPLQIPAPPSRTSHTRIGEDVPAAAERTLPDAPSAEAMRETAPTPMAPTSPTTDAALEAAGEPPSPNAPRDVKAIPRTPPATPSPVHVSPTSNNAPSVEPVRETPPLTVLAPSPSTTNAATEATGESLSLATEATGEPLSLNAPRDVKAITRTPPAAPQPAHTNLTSSRQARATTEERGEAIRPRSSARAPLAAAFDEVIREQAPAVERRVADELQGSTAAVDIEVIPRTSKTPQSDSDSEPLSKGVLQPLNPAASADARPFTQVRPLTAPPSAPREESTQTQPPPTIEVTIGRIEVRALTTPAPPPGRRHEPPRMSLDDYLRAQGGGRS